MKIIIIDDFSPILQLLTDCLSQYGFTDIECFTDPGKALSFLKSHTFQEYRSVVVLCDMDMPHITGETLLNNCMKTSPSSFIPVLITASPSMVQSDNYPIFDKGESDFILQLKAFLEGVVDQNSTNTPK